MALPLSQIFHLSQRSSRSQALFRLLKSNFRAFAPLYILAFVAMACESMATGYSAYILKDIINKVFIDKKLYDLYFFAVVIIGVYLLKGGASYVASFSLARTGNGVIARVQAALYDSLLRQDPEFFSHYSMGDLVMRSTTNAQVARGVLDLVVTGLGRDVTTLVALVSVMVMQNWLMSVAAFFTAPLAIVGVRILIKHIEELTRREVASSAKIITYIQEAIYGIRIVKAFGMERRFERDIDYVISDVEKRSNRIVQLNSITSPMMEFLAGMAIAMVVAFGGFEVVYMGQSAGSFFSFITALLLAYEPAKRIAALNASLAPALIGLEMMYEILDTKPKIVDADDAETFIADKADLTLENVTFSYRPDALVLDDVSLEARVGTVTALVGPSGAGKSTIFSLIERFYDVVDGRVALNGHDIRSLTTQSVRSHVALVTQDTFLFEDTIAANIADGRSSASMDEIIAAARDANAYDFVMAMPDGFETTVTQGGASLSGGQRQRIAIARAILRQAPILLLDEATSALDAQSEAEVQEALARLMEGRTTLVIAHRLSTVRNADNIYVMDRGKVVQFGTHRQLLARGGLYAHLYELQFREHKEPNAADGGSIEDQEDDSRMQPFEVVRGDA